MEIPVAANVELGFNFLIWLKTSVKSSQFAAQYNLGV